MNQVKIKLKKVGTDIELAPAAEDEIMKARNKESVSRSLSTTKKRIDISPQEEEEKCLVVFKDVVTFVARGKMYGRVAVTFVSE